MKKILKHPVVRFILLILILVVLISLLFARFSNYPIGLFKTEYGHIQRFALGSGAIAYQLERSRFDRTEPITLRLYFAQFEEDDWQAAYAYDGEIGVAYYLDVNQTGRHFDVQSSIAETFNVPGTYPANSFIYPSNFRAFFDYDLLPFQFSLTFMQKSPFYDGIEGTITVSLGSMLSFNEIQLHYAGDEDELVFSTVSVANAKWKLGL